MNDQRMEDILRDRLQKLGWPDWSRKQPTLFSLKSKYGSIMPAKRLSEIYDKIYDEELQKKEKEEE